MAAALPAALHETAMSVSSMASFAMRADAEWGMVSMARV